MAFSYSPEHGRNASRAYSVNTNSPLLTSDSLAVRLDSASSPASLPVAGILQAKLTISHPEDEDEQENLAEDASLLYQATRRGHRLQHLSNVYVRHGRNAWRDFAPGSFINPAGWERIPSPLIFPPTVLASYKAAATTN